MRGALVTFLALVAGYAILQNGAADQISSSSGFFATTLRRLSDPTVSGIRQRGMPGVTWHAGTPPAAPGGSTGGIQQVPTNTTPGPPATPGPTVHV